MKHFIFACFLGSFSFMFAQKNNSAQAKLNQATVYFSSAELSHSVAVTLNKGTNEVTIKNVAENINENTIQVLAPKNVTVMSLYSTKDKLETEETNPTQKHLKDSVNLLQKEIRQITIQKEANKKTIELLDQNQKVSGANSGLNVTELTKMVDYYTQKRQKLSETIENLTEKEQKINKLLEKLRYKLENNTDNYSRSNGKIVLQLMSDAAQKVDLKINYITPDAFWFPAYELRAESTIKPIDLIYKGLLTQYTGIDWKNVKLTLSSGFPNQNNEITQLQAWHLTFERPQKPKAMRARNAVVKEEMAAAKLTLPEDALYEVTSVGSVNHYTEISENQLNVSFDIDIPYHISSNGKEHSIALKELKLPAKYHYYSAPKADNNVYLVADIENYSQYNLLQGEANIIFEGLYVGKTTINPNQTSEILPLSMGRDKKISIKREKITDKSGTKFLSSYQEQTFTFDIIVRNNKNETAEITLKDQYPLSSDKEITVELLNHSGAKIDEEKGILTWEFSLKPSETKTFRISYKVKYPRERMIGNL